MAGIKDYSTSAGSNTSISSISVAEGCAPSGINDAIRQLMADVRSDYIASEWIDLGYATTYASGTTFTVASDVTAQYLANRRIKAVGSSTGTIYGKITGSSYSAPNTTVTVSWDSGSLSNETLTISVGRFKPTGYPLDVSAVKGSGDFMADGSVPMTGSLTLGGAATGIVFEGTTADAFETTLTAGEPTADRAIALPDASGTLLLSNGDGSGLTGIASSPAFKNILINGAFQVNQRAPASNADDTYAHDRWNVLTQTGTIAVSTVTDAENTTPYMARLTQSQASAQRMGYSQIIEGKNCKHLRGQSVTFRIGRTRLSSSANVRFAVLEWTGTEDSVTSDVVNDWTSGTYTAGNFFLASNLTVSGVVQQALTANTLTTGSSVSVTLGSSFTNLIVFAWTEGTVAQNVTFDLAKAQLEAASTASSFEVIPVGVTFNQCQRYFETSYPLGTTVPTNSTSSGKEFVWATSSPANQDNFLYLRWMVKKRSAPSFTAYSYTSSTANTISTAGGTDLASGSASGNGPSDRGTQIYNNSGGSIAPTNGGFIFHWKADSEL